MNEMTEMPRHMLPGLLRVEKSGFATFSKICAPSLVGAKTPLPAVPARKEAILQSKIAQKLTRMSSVFDFQSADGKLQ